MRRLLPDIAGDLGQAGPADRVVARLLAQEARPRQFLQRLCGHLLLQQQPEHRRPRPRQQQRRAQR